MSTPNTSVSNGTITTPPPSPVNDPSIPARNDPRVTSNVNSSVFNFSMFSVQQVTTVKKRDLITSRFLFRGFAFCNQVIHKTNLDRPVRTRPFQTHDLNKLL